MKMNYSGFGGIGGHLLGRYRLPANGTWNTHVSVNDSLIDLTLNHSPKKMTIQTVFMINKLCVLHWQTQDANLTQVDQPQSFYKRNALLVVLSWIGAGASSKWFFFRGHPFDTPTLPRPSLELGPKIVFSALQSVKWRPYTPSAAKQVHHWIINKTILAANGPAFP